jgi:hypothetical protein
VRLAFAMTINKAQGQSLAVAGVNLETSCFSHGQLYVACSRVGTPKSLYVFATAGQTKNVVYSSVQEPIKQEPVLPIISEPSRT